MKKCILILSSPRSGSSCLSGCLELCGLDLGKDVARHKDKWNKKGYYENRDILNTNEHIMKESGVPMFCTTVPAQIVEDCYRRQVLRVLNRQFDSSLFGIKDPRILFMRFVYLGALADFGAEVKVLGLGRTPEHSARSIKDGPWIHGDHDTLKTHAVYTQLLEEFGYGHYVKFEDLINDPEGTMRGVCDFAGMTYNPAVESFVDRSLVNYGSLPDV